MPSRQGKHLDDTSALHLRGVCRKVCVTVYNTIRPIIIPDSKVRPWTVEKPVYIVGIELYEGSTFVELHRTTLCKAIFVAVEPYFVYQGLPLVELLFVYSVYCDSN